MSGPNGKWDDAEDLLPAVRAGSPDVVVTGQGCSFLTLVFFLSVVQGSQGAEQKLWGHGDRRPRVVSCGCGQQVNNGREGRLVLRILSRSNCWAQSPTLLCRFELFIVKGSSNQQTQTTNNLQLLLAASSVWSGSL